MKQNNGGAMNLLQLFFVTFLFFVNVAVAKNETKDFVLTAEHFQSPKLQLTFLRKTVLRSANVENLKVKIDDYRSCVIGAKSAAEEVTIAPKMSFTTKTKESKEAGKMEAAVDSWDGKHYFIFENKGKEIAMDCDFRFGNDAIAFNDERTDASKKRCEAMGGQESSAGVRVVVVDGASKQLVWMNCYKKIPELTFENLNRAFKSAGVAFDLHQKAAENWK